MLRASTVDTAADMAFNDASDCLVCRKKFFAFRKKHRCRACGNAVCNNCSHTRKVLSASTLSRFHNEPVRVCDQCVRNQSQRMQERRRAQDIERARARQVATAQQQQREAEERMQRTLSMRRTMEAKHFGPRRLPSDIQRSRSLGPTELTPLAEKDTTQKVLDRMIVEASGRAMSLAPVFKADLENKDPVEAVGSATVVQEAEECALCLEVMSVGQAVFTTSCGHSFHWCCLKDITMSESSNYDKCPSCRTELPELKEKRVCDHPRVRVGHQFCRDCGHQVSSEDAKPPPSTVSDRPSYRAGNYGALVRCPMCQIQVRVLPHMYNLRVACPAGHMFLVQVAGQNNSRGSVRPSTQVPARRNLFPTYYGNPYF